MTQLFELQSRLLAFRNERNWERFHDPKSLAAALGAEVGELLEQVMWLSPDESRSLTSQQSAAIRDEVADITIFALHLANSVVFDLGEAIDDKLKVVAERPDNDYRNPATRSALRAALQEAGFALMKDEAGESYRIRKSLISIQAVGDLQAQAKLLAKWASHQLAQAGFNVD